MQASVGDIPTEASHDPPPQGLLQIASQPPVPSNGQLGGASFLLETGTTCERCYIGKVRLGSDEILSTHLGFRLATYMYTAYCIRGINHVYQPMRSIMTIKCADYSSPIEHR
jgi:hypothetical protein